MTEDKKLKKEEKRTLETKQIPNEKKKEKKEIMKYGCKKWRLKTESKGGRKKYDKKTNCSKK